MIEDHRNNKCLVYDSWLMYFFFIKEIDIYYEKKIIEITNDLIFWWRLPDWYYYKRDRLIIYWYRSRHGHNQIQGSSWTQSDTGVVMDTIRYRGRHGHNQIQGSSWTQSDTGVVMNTIRYRSRHGHNQIQGSSWTQSDTGVIMDTIVLTAIFISDCHVKWCWGNNFLTFSGEGKGAICFIFISYYAKLYRKLKINCLDLKDVKKKLLIWPWSFQQEILLNYCMSAGRIFIVE